MTSPHKEKAFSLRLEGKSIREIALALRISKSTISHWCRDIVLSKNQLSLLAARQQRGGAIGRLRAAESKRADRIKRTAIELRKGAKELGTVSDRDLFILGLALYWGEGYKNGNSECGLTNSDPAIILTFIQWLENVYGVGRGDLIARVSINHIHHDRVSEVEKHWSDIINIPHSQFTSASLIKTSSKKTYADRDRHFGTLRIKVRRGTSLRRRIMGSINALASRFEN